MTRPSKRELERALEELTGASVDPDAPHPIEHDFSETERETLDFLTVTHSDDEATERAADAVRHVDGLGVSE